MNTREIVMLTADPAYIPVKYAVIEVTVGSTLANSYVWLKCIGNGMAKADFLDLKANQTTIDHVDKSKLTGTVGAFSVSNLGAISEYSSPDSLTWGNVRLG